MKTPLELVQTLLSNPTDIEHVRRLTTEDVTYVTRLSLDTGSGGEAAARLRSADASCGCSSRAGPVANEGASASNASESG